MDEALTEDWRKINNGGHESLSQSLGRAAFSCHLEAILVPSAQASGGINLVYFPENLHHSGKVVILEENDLKRHLK